MREEFFMIDDVRGGPETVRNVVSNLRGLRLLAERVCGKGVKRFFFLGCGSSYYAALFGAWPLVCSGVQAYALPSSEFLFYYSGLAGEGSVVVGVSRSGLTAETVSAVRKARENGAFTVSFTTGVGSELSRECGESFLVDVGEEKSIIMTKSFVGLSLASAIFSSEVSRNLFGGDCRLAGDLSKLSTSAEELLKRESLLQDMAYARVRGGVERFVFLGSGPAYPIALEGALKVKETSYVASEAFHTLEFRHGPMSTLGEKQTLFLVACRGEGFTPSKRLHSEMLEKNADVIVLTNAQEEFEKPIWVPYVESEEAAALLSIIPVQLFAYHYATARGRNPDRPRNLSRYVERF